MHFVPLFPQQLMNHSDENQHLSMEHRYLLLTKSFWEKYSLDKKNFERKKIVRTFVEQHRNNKVIHPFQMWQEKHHDEEKKLNQLLELYENELKLLILLNDYSTTIINHHLMLYQLVLYVETILSMKLIQATKKKDFHWKRIRREINLISLFDSKCCKSLFG